MSQNPSLEAIRQAVLSFVNADNWSQSKQIVEAQQDLLLVDEADVVFAHLLAQYADDAQATRTLSSHRDLLQRCRTEGIDATFADKLHPATPDIPPELTAQLMAIESEAQLTELVTAHPELLPVLAAMQQANQQATSGSVEELADKLSAFIRADSWAESKAYLSEHPELLTDEALGVLTQLIGLAQQQGDEDLYQALIQHRDLLQHCRVEGIDAAFVDLVSASTSAEGANELLPLLNALVQCDSPRAVFELAAEHSELLSDEMDALLQQAIANAQAQATEKGEAYAQHVAERLNALRQLRQMMREAEVSAEEAAQTGLAEIKYQQVFDAVLAFVNADSWDESKHLVEQERELLLTDMALQVFADLLSQYKEDANVTRTLIQHRNLLQRCRTESIDAAFADKVRSTNILPELDASFTNLVRSMPIGSVSGEAQALLQETAQSDNQIAFVLENLARFTEQVQAAFAQMLAQAEGKWAQGLYRLLEVIDRAFWQQKRASLTPSQQAMLDEVDALWEQEERVSYERQRLLCVYLLATLSREQIPQVWAYLHYTSGQTCFRLYELTNEPHDATAAISHYTAALSVYRCEVAPSQWAMTQHALGNLFSKFYSRSNQQEQAQAARHHYNQALLVYRREVAPSQWAMMQHALGSLFSIFYEQSNQQEQAQAAQQHYNQALEVRRREVASADWAMTQYALGNIFSRLYERSNQQEQAQAAQQHYNQALSVYRREVAPSQWAVTQHALGVLFSNSYERSNQQEQAQAAQQHYNQALSVYRREVAPADWAMTQYALGHLFSKLYERSNQQEQAQAAQRHYNQALEVRRREVAPSQWAMTQHALGTLFLKLYERSNQQEQAQAAQRHYNQALEVRRREVAPSQWAMTQYALGHLFSKLYERSNQQEQAQAARQHYNQALSVYRREVAPSQWAMTQHALGTVFSILYKRSNEQEQAQAARHHYNQALSVYRREVAPADWAMTQYELGNIYSTSYASSNQQEQAQAAQHHYNQALSVYRREVAPAAWARTQNALGNIYSKIYSFSNQQEQAEQAKHAYQQALAEWTPLVAPDFRLKAARSLARLYVGLEQWAEAEGSYQTALDAAQRQFLAAGSDSERKEFVKHHAALFAEDAFCLHQLGKLEAAWGRLEQGHARLLGETLGLSEAARLHHEEASVARLRAARQRLALAEANYAATEEQRYQTNHQTAQQAYQQSVDAVREAWQALKRLAEELELEAPTLNADELKQLPLPADTAAIALLLGDKSAHALLLHQGELIDIALPASCTKAKLRERVMHLPAEVDSWIGAYNDRQKARRALSAAQSAEEGISTAQEEFSSAQKRFQSALEALAQSEGNYQAGWYESYRIAYGLTHRKKNHKAHRAAFTAWQNKVQETLDFLSKEFWPPLVAALEASHPDKGIKQVLLMPSDVTSLLPLHAAAPAHLSVGYIPSLTVWQRSRDRAAGRSADSLFVATPATEKDDLPFSEVEAEWLAQRFPPEAVKRLLRPQATADAIQTQATGYGIVHFSGHARYNWEEPNNSHLKCKDSTLSLATIRREMDLSHARLVTLSACETGVNDVFDSSEEFIGLPAGLLEAGAPAVVASLWPVEDVSAAFLIDRFYELWLGHDISIAQALQQAAQWLRHASKADLLKRIAASLPPDEQAEVLELAEQLMAHNTPRMAMPIIDNTIMAIISKPDEQPYAHPFYWAAFAAYGAVL